MCSFETFGRLPTLLLKLIVIHEAWVRGILPAAGLDVYRDDHGAPIPSYTTSTTCGRNGPIVLEDMTLIQNLAHFDREKIPERVVHALGSGAFGELIITHDITRYSKAAVFSKIGSKTPLAIRFSTVTHERGGADVGRNPRGFSIKFYTSDGIWDCTGNNTPIFFVRDPMLFPAMVHSQKRNPKTNRYDPNLAWDFITKRQEMLFQVMRVFSDLGTPDGFIYMDGFGSHTFILVNKNDVPTFCKFHFRTNQGVRNLTAEAATKIAGENPDYSAQQLFEAIEAGNYPSWSMYIQVMTPLQAQKFRFSVLDVTKIWPENEYPLIPVGQIVLNRNPENFFHEIEQLAFCPSHLVPGIQPSRDRMLQARMFSYKDSQRHRLGANFMQLPVNRPLQPPFNIQRDGPMNYFNQGSTVNYFPNSYTYLAPDPSSDNINYTTSGIVARHDTGDDDNYSQPRDWYVDLSAYDKEALAKNIAADIKDANQSIKNRVYSAFANVHQNLAKQIAMFTQAS